MIRGNQTITAIFLETTPKPKALKASYTVSRDIMLSYRFYFYFHIKKEQYETAVGFLENEFCISPRTITDKLVEQQFLLRDIKSNDPTRKQLRLRYPHFNWN